MELPNTASGNFGDDGQSGKFRALFNEQMPRLMGLALKLRVDLDKAQDLAQDAMLILVVRLQSGSPAITCPAAFLTGTLKRLVMQWRRQGARSAKLLAAFAHCLEERPKCLTAIDLAKTVLPQALDEVEANGCASEQAGVRYLRDQLDGKSIREIATANSISENTVKRRLHSARTAVRVAITRLLASADL